VYDLAIDRNFGLEPRWQRHRGRGRFTIQQTKIDVYSANVSRWPDRAYERLDRWRTKRGR
jgi:hypothetical protein